MSDQVKSEMIRELWLKQFLSEKDYRDCIEDLATTGSYCLKRERDGLFHRVAPSELKKDDSVRDGT